MTTLPATTADPSPLSRRGRGGQGVRAATTALYRAAFYAALFALAGVAAACLVVPRGFSDALGHPVAVSDYAELAWLTCSLATLGGALGAGVETDEVIREAAYLPHSDTDIVADPD